MAASTKLVRDFDQKLTDFDGTPIRLGGNADGMLKAVNDLLKLISSEVERADMPDKAKEIVKEAFGVEEDLASVAIAGLVAPHEGEKPDEKERIRRFELARRLHKGGEQEITPEERDLIKKLIGKRFNGSLIAPMAWEMLETDPPEAGEPQGEASA